VASFAGDMCQEAVAEQLAREDGHVARGRDVPDLIQAVRIAEVGRVRAERTRLLVHQLDEVLVAGGVVCCERHRGVVRGLQQQRVEQLADGDAHTRLQREIAAARL
jgi:hypothetical protein